MAAIRLGLKRNGTSLISSLSEEKGARSAFKIITDNLLRQAALLSLTGDGYIKGFEPSKKTFRYLCCLLLLLLLLYIFFTFVVFSILTKGWQDQPS